MLDHTGHRKRIRDQLSNMRFDQIPDEKLLEVAFFHLFTRTDTVPAARNLLSRFGNIRKVIETPKNELIKVDKVGPKTAQFLSHIQLLFRRCEQQGNEARETFSSPEEYGPYLERELSDWDQEVFLVMCLDRKYRLLFQKVFPCKQLNLETAKKVMSIALNSNAHFAILARNGLQYNHLCPPNERPQGNDMRDVLISVGICLLDYVIVADGTYQSMGPFLFQAVTGSRYTGPG